MTRRVLVIGGAGTFGFRLVQGILATTDLDIVIAGRDLARAEAACRDLGGGARLSALRLDAGSVSAAALRASGAFVVVDAAGPFQGAQYTLARAAIAAGLAYMDLADGRAFVAGFGALDAEAKAAGVVAVSGASSTPALSNAVLDRLTAGWRRVDTVEIAISPGNRAPRGLSVMRAILSYAGQPVRVFLDGRWTTRAGWSGTVAKRIGDLGRRFVSLCETPDLDIVPARIKPTESAIFRAGVELPLLQFGLAAASLLVRLKLLRSLEPFARPFLAIADALIGFGSDRGGMLIEARGIDASGARVAASWTLVAEAGDGPFVPTLPALALLRRIADGTLGETGARPCVGLLALAEIERECARHRIATSSEVKRVLSPFECVLGAAFATLPEPVRRVHALDAPLATEGRAEIHAAPGLLPRLIRFVAGLPGAGSDVPVTVDFDPLSDGGESWRRRFADRRYRSALHAGTWRGEPVLIERLGMVRLAFRLTSEADGLHWRLVAWHVLRVRLPGWSLPRIECLESGDGDRFVFDIGAAFPIIGTVIQYRGWLRPVQGATRR